MKSQLRFVSITFRACLAVFLFGALPMTACDHSNSVGKVGDTSAGGIASGGATGSVSAGGSAAASAAGTAAGGTTAATVGEASAAGKGGGGASGQAGASGASSGGKGGAAGSSAVDAGVDRYQCPLTNIYCADGYTTDVYGCTICAAGGTGGGGGGGTTAKGGASGTRADAAADAHECPPQGYINCPNYTYDAYGCKLCDLSGTGGSSGGTSGKGGTGAAGAPGGAGTTGTAGTSGSGGTTAKTCQRGPEQDSVCRSQNLPPLSYFCQVPAQPATKACQIYNIIDSGSFYCCPEPYLDCPDSPPTNGATCTDTVACTYGSHPDPTCRTSASCANGTWRVTAPPSRCSDQQLPATCPAAPVTGTACSSHGLNCGYADGNFCTCNTCTVEDPLCNAGATDKWRCWTPPGGDCPTYYPNLGTICSLPANTRCRYTCASNTTCSAAGVWVNGGVLCPECNSPDTPIATPDGNRPIASLVPGDLVYSINHGQVDVVPIAEVGRRAQNNHHVVRVQLATGVVLEISPRHPTADGRTIGMLAAGDRLDGVRVLSAELIPYRHSHTYDILPASDTATYYAGGVLIGSTMSPDQRPLVAPAPVSILSAHSK